MSYSNATFYIDPESGSDAARTALLTCVASNPSGTITRINKTAHGLVTGAVVDLTLFTAWLNSAWKITVVDANNFDLDGAVWQATADNNGTVTPRGGSSKADAWSTLNNGATAARTQAGDDVRLKASPDPTTLGDGVWTSSKKQNAVSISSSTNTSPIQVTTSAAHGCAAGDDVFINSHNTNTNANGWWKVLDAPTSTTLTLGLADGSNSTGNGAGTGGTITKVTNMRVELSAAVTKNVALCGNRNQKPNWTASANITTSIVNAGVANKEGIEYLQIAIAAGFTTGKAAYYTLPSAIDLSAYQQLSFFLKPSSNSLLTADADVSIKLCSDTTGDTPLHTFNLPANTNANLWTPYTIDNGAALSASVQSIAVYVNVDRGAGNILLDNIIACKAPSDPASLSLTSLLGKNVDGEYWWAIQSINDRRVCLDSQVGQIAPSQQRGYYGVSETVPTYKREPITYGAGLSLGTSQRAGTSASAMFTITGGWDRTNMAVQSGETWFSRRFDATSVVLQLAAFNAIDKVSFAHYAAAPLSISADCRIGTMNFAGGTGGISFNTLRLTVTDALNFIGGASVVQAGGSVTGSGNNINALRFFSTVGQPFNGLVLWGSYIGSLEIKNCASPNTTTGVGVRYGSVTLVDNAAGLTIDREVTIGTLTITNCAAAAITPVTNGIGSSLVLGGSTSGNTSGVAWGNTHLNLCLRNFSIGEATKIAASTSYTNLRVELEKESGVAAAHTIYLADGLIQAQTSVVYSGSAYAWKFSPTNATTRDSNFPVDIPIARRPVKAGSLVTVSARVQRDNTGLTMRLKCKGGQLTGVGSVGSDISASSAAAANTWEQLTITFTPTEDGVVEFTMEAWGGSAWNGYYDPHDLQITQA